MALPGPRQWAKWRALLARGCELPRPPFEQQLMMRLTDGLAPARPLDAPPADARAAAVVVLAMPAFGDGAADLPGSGADPADPVFPVMVRGDNMTSHAGEVSLPGGRAEPGESPREAALRELREELSGADCDSAGIEVIGELPAVYVPVSRHAVTTVVAAAPRRLPLSVRSLPEAAALHAMRLRPLVANPGAAGCRRLLFTHEGRERDVLVPHYSLPGCTPPVWGFTCLVLSELAARLRAAAGLPPHRHDYARLARRAGPPRPYV
eukprot:TRINITY_DN28914_c0_g1_i1.p1 TRINITY_DN28914_c0_g1~~TRINITY_DN28914_c0_g1_i1.p1  ORF type:complete len:288 (+),score=73.12 TRINITY_DN28914_c0_g1_i1:72-866(+)